MEKKVTIPLQIHANQSPLKVWIFKLLIFQTWSRIYYTNIFILSWPQNGLEWSAMGLRERIDDYKLCKIKQSRR